MKWNGTNLKTRLYLAAALVLIIGMGASVLIYLTTGEADVENPLGNPLDESKSYRRSLELYGGKANLVASEFMQWLGSLWHGKALGITVGSITAIVCLIIFLIAHNLPSDPD